MRAITVRQPWAWAIVHAGKDVENRSRNIAGSYRGPVAIHAGLGRFVTGTAASRAHRAAHGTEVPTALHFGAVIGVAELVDVHHSCRAVGPLDPDDNPYCSPWAMHGHHHLVLADARPLTTPIPARGRLGLWTPDDELVEAITRQVA